MFPLYALLVLMAKAWGSIEIDFGIQCEIELKVFYLKATVSVRFRLLNIYLFDFKIVYFICS